MTKYTLYSGRGRFETKTALQDKKAHQQIAKATLSISKIW